MTVGVPGSLREYLAWYGVRVFNDAVAAATEIPNDENLAAMLDAEDQAGRRDPYRWMASQFHVIARARTTDHAAHSCEVA